MGQLSLFGCATLAQRKQFISVQTEPQGLAISLERKPKGYLGTTPLFVELESAPSVSLFGLYDVGASRKIVRSCRFAWEQLLLGNFPVAVALGPTIGGIYFAGALATDLLTESAFECPARINLKLKSQPSYRPSYSPPDTPLAPSKTALDSVRCRVIVVAPPYHFSSQVSEQIFADWEKSIASQLEKCDVILPLENTRSHLAQVNITFDKPVTLRSIKRWQLNMIGLKTGATHFADIKVMANEETVIGSTTLYDLHSNENLKLDPVELPVLFDSNFQSEFVQAIDQALMLIPNSLQVSSFFTWPEFDQTKASYKLYRTDDDRSWKSFLSGWETSYIPRPASFRNFSLRFNLYPAFWSHLSERRMNMYWRYSNIDPKDGQFAFKEVLELWYLGATVESRAYLMTEFGAAFLGAGVGYANINGAMRGENTNKSSVYMHAYLGYLVETGPQSFLEISGGLALTPEPHYESQYTSLSEFLYLRAKAGFYLDQMRERVRRLL